MGTYFGIRLHFFLIVTIFIFYLFNWIELCFFLVLLYIGLVIFYRKRTLYDFKIENYYGENVNSPIYGKVISILKDIDHPYFGNGLREIKISQKVWRGFGVYFPISSEVYDYIEGGQESEAPRLGGVAAMREGGGYSLIFETEKKTQVGLTLQGFFLGRGGGPRINLIQGDRGQVGANLGYFPFGGTVFLYLPDNYEIMIYEGQNVMVSSIIADIKEKN